MSNSTSNEDLDTTNCSKCIAEYKFNVVMAIFEAIMVVIMIGLGLKVLQIVRLNSKRIGKIKQNDKTLIAVIFCMALTFFSDTFFYALNAITKKKAS